MFKRLARSQGGFGLHMILPLIAVLVVGAIGAYMQFSSSAYVPPEGWVTIKSATGTWKVPPSKAVVVYSAAANIVAGSKYRVCGVAKYSSGSSTNVSIQPGSKYSYISLTSSYTTRCTSTFTWTQSMSIAPTLWQKAGQSGYATFTKVYWQKYY